ncbi:hypothetical protein EV421DRAFT_104416 [Armillaria borealis]|uniref:Uncharacterized protein n=1 Tax=Armillaria borealis TaxID=47425 RepID=A0AA39KBV5_9AGAR|nr:hypothetical protein EV421DRAFT_104416 [Armillaria borealis]
MACHVRAVDPAVPDWDLVPVTTPTPTPPPPTTILRSHSSGVTTLFIFLDNDQIYSEDGSGLVVSTSMRTLRPISAHSHGLLVVQEWGANIMYGAFGLVGSIIYTKGCRQGRDNKLRIEEIPGIGGSAALNRPFPYFGTRWMWIP